MKSSRRVSSVIVPALHRLFVLWLALPLATACTRVDRGPSVRPVTIDQWLTNHPADLVEDLEGLPTNGERDAPQAGRESRAAEASPTRGERVEGTPSQAGREDREVTSRTASPTSGNRGAIPPRPDHFPDPRELVGSPRSCRSPGYRRYEKTGEVQKTIP